MAFQTTQFKAGSYALIEGKRDKNVFYIILQGAMRTQRLTQIKGIEASQILGPGDFFGVESAMADRSRVETVIAMSDCKLIEIHRSDFGTLIQKNSPIAMKIIRSFSAKLRNFDNAIASSSFQNAMEEDPRYLFKMGEHWLHEGRKDHAAYALYRYLELKKDGDHIGKAKEYLRDLANEGIGLPKNENQNMNRTYPEGEIVFCEHELGEELYIIQKGNVKITKMVEGKEVFLAGLQEGDIFGEMAILESKPRTASAICAENTSILAINKSNFESMVRMQPLIATKLITLLSERIWMAYRQLANISIKDPMSRLYDMLLTIAEKNRSKIAPNIAYSYDFGGEELMPMVGLPLADSENYLMTMIKNRWLKIEKGKIICTDTDELRKQVDQYRRKMDLERRRKIS